MSREPSQMQLPVVQQFEGGRGPLAFIKSGLRKRQRYSILGDKLFNLQAVFCFGLELTLFMKIFCLLINVL